MKKTCIALMILATSTILTEPVKAGWGCGPGGCGLSRLAKNFSRSGYSGRSSYGTQKTNYTYRSNYGSQSSHSSYRPMPSPATYHAPASNTYGSVSVTASPSYTVSTPAPVYHASTTHHPQPVAHAAPSPAPSAVYVAPVHTAAAVTVAKQPKAKVSAVHASHKVPEKSTKSIHIACAEGQSGECIYTLITSTGNHLERKMTAGKRQVIDVEAAWKIKFRPSKNADWVGFVLKPGHHYSFEHDAENGWQLYED